MTGGFLRGAVLAVAMAAAAVAPPAAHAAGPTGSSSQNVVAAPAGTDAAAMAAERERLFAAMLADPSDLDAAFAYAALSARMGDLEGAISTLERMLIFSPGLSRLQYELGVLYFRLGAFTAAEGYLRAAEAAPDVPPEARAEIAAYLAAIDRGKQGSGVSGYVTAGLRYQTNANAGPATSAITLNGLPFVLGPSAMGTPDVNIYLGGTINGVIDLENQGDRFLISVTGQGTVYRTQGTLNTGVVEFRAGPDFNLGRIGLENSTAGIYAIAAGSMAGGAPYSAALGVGSSVTVGIDARSEVTLKGEARYETYLNSAARPTASLRTGPDFMGSARYSYALAPNLDVYATGSLTRHLGQTAYMRTWQVAGEIGAGVTVESPFEASPGRWRFAAAAGVQRQLADGPDLIFSTDPELTTRLYLQGKVTIPLPNDFSLDASAVYIRSLSNYPLSVYDNFAVSVGAGKGF